MKQNSLRRTKTLVIIIMLLGSVSVLLMPSNDVFAYSAGSTWQNGTGFNYSSQVYSIDPGIDSVLGIPGAGDYFANSVVPIWNKATWFGWTRSTPYNPGGRVPISHKNFSTELQCGADMNSFAVNCVDATSVYLRHTLIYFNDDATHYTWNNSGTTSCASYPRPADFHTIALHEFGHSFYLADGPSGHPEAVMSFNCSTKRTLAEDDKQGAVQLYGPRTSWEVSAGYPIGEVNRVTYAQNVAGYYNTFSPPPELGPRAMEAGVPVFTGAYYEVIAGYARSSYSYVYNKLFTFDNDSSTQHNYLKITNGMKFRWFQYNYQQSSASIDFHMTDGSNLRDKNLVDQNGIPTHPAARAYYPTGQWLYSEVDLSPLVGKTIDYWMIAYDNGNNGITGQFRSYFDNFRIEYTYPAPP